MKILKCTLFLLLTVNIFSCSEKGKMEYNYFQDGKIANKITYLNDSTAEVLIYFNNGVLRDSMTLINKKTNGQRKRYFENGNLSSDCYYHDDLTNGPCSMYFESGNLEKKAFFEDTIKIGDYYEFFDLPGKKVKFIGNYCKIKGKEIFNYGTWYNENGTVKKSTVGINKITGNKVVTLGDSLKIKIEIKNTQFPLLRAYVGDFDKDYDLPQNSKISTFDGVKNILTIYIKPQKIGKQIARGYIENSELIEKFKNGDYKSKGKIIYWSYDYEVRK